MKILMLENFKFRNSSNYYTSFIINLNHDFLTVWLNGEITYLFIPLELIDYLTGFLNYFISLFECSNSPRDCSNLSITMYLLQCDIKCSILHRFGGQVLQNSSSIPLPCMMHHVRDKQADQKQFFPYCFHRYTFMNMISWWPTTLSVFPVHDKCIR